MRDYLQWQHLVLWCAEKWVRGSGLEVMDAEIYVLTLFWLETARLLPSSLSLLQSTLKKAVNVAAGLLKVQ